MVLELVFSIIDLTDEMSNDTLTTVPVIDDEDDDDEEDVVVERGR